MFQLFRDVEQRVCHPELVENLVRALFHESRARVVILVYPVSETHELDVLFFVLDALNELGDAFAGIANLAEHRQHRFVCSAVQGPAESANARGNRRENRRVR